MSSLFTFHGLRLILRYFLVSALRPLCSAHKATLPIIVLLSALFLSGCQESELYREKMVLMGTFVEVISPDTRAPAIVFNEIKRVESIFSKYKADSQVALLNHNGRIAPSKELFFVAEKARKFWEDSGGAFDVTIGPLMDAWGFTEKEYIRPPDAKISEALLKVGLDKVDIKSNLIYFKVAGMKVDFGAIAKGYAVDRAVKELKNAGINSCLINAGGDIYCLGKKFGRPWRVAVNNPRRSGYIEYLNIEDKAVVTSGDYENFFINNGKRFSHIFNPKTGYPADSGVVSVTVVADDCLTADALATSIFVLGRKEGLELAKKYNSGRVIIISKDDV